MQFGDFLNNLATKIGAQNDQHLVDLLSSAEISQHEIDDELAQRFDTGLMSLEAAKNNSDVLKHLKPILLKAADDKFAILAEKYGISEAIGAEQSTYKKFDILESAISAKIADLEKRAGGSQGENEKKLTKQINDLQAQLAQVTAAKDKEIDDYKKAAAKQQLDFLINLELNGKRYANQDLGDTNVEIARSLITKALQERGAVLVNENGKLKLKQAGSTELDYYDESHKAVSFTDFANRLLADKHLLEVSDNDDHNQHQGSGFQPPKPQTITLPGGKQVDTSRIDAAAAASLADLES